MDRPNILWVTLDSIRADHTSLGGYGRDTTPRMSTLAREGIGFDTCISHAQATHPSTGAILTGRAPSRNTVGISGDVVPDEITTIPERFVDAGYTTAGLSRNSFLSDSTDLDRGFERFQWLASSTLHEAGVRTLLKYLLNIRTHSAGLTTDSAKHATPFLMNDIAKRWLDDFEADENPFFFYLHYNEPHRPYYPPRPYLDRYTDDIAMDPAEAAETALRIHRNLHEIIATGCDLSDDEFEALIAMYDAEIAYTDEMIGRLVDYVRSLDVGPTVVIVTADHGELFGEYGLLSHKYVLHDGVTRVPLVATGLGDLVVDGDDVIQHWDVMRTLLEMADVDTGGLLGHDLRTETPEFAVSQRAPMDFERMLEYNPDFDTDRFHAETLTAIRTDRFKYQTSGDRSELFELPNEETDVSAEYPSVVDDLGAKLGEWLDEHGDPVGDAREGAFSGAVEKQLRQLGYID
jgi:uncharacterized sulfatase